MFRIYEKIIYKVNDNEEYIEAGYNEEYYSYEYPSMKDAIDSGDFSPQIIEQMEKANTVSMQNLARSGTTRALKQEGVTFLCSVTI